MAITVSRKMSELEAQCRRMGIKVEPQGKKMTKTDYVLALREFYLNHIYKGNVPESLSLILQMETPMLCSRFSEFDAKKKEEIWNSDEWIIEAKEDGVRLVSVFNDGKWDCFSRNISVKDFLPINYSEKILKKDINLSLLTDSFIIDSEIICTNPHICTIMGKRGVICETQLQAVTALLGMNKRDSLRIQEEENCPLELRVFDVVWWNGEWIKDKPLIERIPYVEKAVAQLQEAGVKCRRPWSSYSNKRMFYKAVIAMGGEGGVLKNLRSPYVDTSSRRKDGFVKVKRSMSEVMRDAGICDGIDAFVSGYEEADEEKAWAGMVGALEFSVFLQKDGKEEVHKIAVISSIPNDLREKITDYDENHNPVLKSDYYGKVATIDGQCISARAKRLRHARIVEWRDDRSADSCVMDDEYLNSMIL